MFTQKIYKYIQEEKVTELETILESGVQRVILDSLLAFAIKYNKIESIKLLLKYCANINEFPFNKFYIKNYIKSNAVRQLLLKYINRKD